MENSKHSYERLNWNIKLYSPIIKYENQLLSVGDSEVDICDCIELSKESTIILKGKASLGQPCPKNPKFLNCEIIDNIVIMVRLKMLNWFNKFKEENNKIIFTSLTVPPTTIITVHNKKIQYGLSKIDDQIRFLRSKVSLYFASADILNYILVFERTATGMIHAHFLTIDNNEYNEGYKDLAHIMGYKTYKMCNINIVEKVSYDIDIIDYLCKIQNKIIFTK